MNKKSVNLKSRKGKSKLPEIQDLLIDFDLWFYKKLRKNEVRKVQRNEIWLFFVGKGLKSKELSENFDKIFKLY